MTSSNPVSSHRWKRYPKYRDSKVAWLGEIPDGWQLIKAKWLFKEIVDRNHPDEPLLSVTQQNSVVAREDSEIRVWNPTEDISGYKLVKKGDFVISLRSFQGGIEHSSVQGIVSPAYIVLRKKDAICDNYFRLLFKSEPFISVLNISTTGIRQGKNIGYEDFSLNICPALPQKDCESIASFLDRETACIDALIAKKERQIELLQEKRAALISHAVTKGLDPNEKMEDSGVKGIGEMPKHWNLHKFPSIVDFQEGPGIMAVDFHENGVPLLRIGNVEQSQVNLNGCNYLSEEKVREKWNHYRLYEHDLLISCSASTGLVSEVTKESEGAIAYTGIIRLRPRERIIERYFLKWFINSDLFLNQIELLKSGTTIQHYGPTHLNQIFILIPPKVYQKIIIDYLDRETARIDTLIEKVRHSIEFLKEYRSTLISAAVTGKIDVRVEVQA